MSPIAAMWLIILAGWAIAVGLYLLQYYRWRNGRLIYVALISGLGQGGGVVAAGFMREGNWTALGWLVVFTPIVILFWYSGWRLRKPIFEERGMRWW